jgi:DUF4097 and DUF4098 domain-containing protein YvlB
MIMKKIATIFLSCLMSANVQAEEVDKTIDAASDGHVDISNIAGSISVKSWSRDAVQVSGTLGKNVEELIFERDGNTILIKVKVPRGNNRSIGSDLIINVPANSSIDVGTISADIDVNGVRGGQTLHTVSGDVDADISGDSLSAESVSGDVNIEGDNADGDVSASSVSGDVMIFRAAGEVDAESVSGDVAIDEGSFDRVQLAAVSGDVEFLGELRSDGKMEVETVSGTIDIDFRGDLSASFEIETLNGDIDNCFGPKAERASKYAPGLELEFTEGKGSGDVEVSAVNGDVTICKE